MREYLPGTEIMPGWETVRLIGGGGSGKVYEARKKDEEGGHYISAIKVVSVPASSDEYAQYLDDGYDDESILEIFRSQVDSIASEFVMMSQFKGMTNIVSYEDHAIIPHPDKRGWDVAIRMELLTSLTELLKTKGLSEKDIVQLGIDICTALELCAKQNIIHRDIKPQNVFINSFGNFKLGDFGVAKAMERPSHATRVGTSGYMAPEIYNNQTCDGRIDQYSLGLMMYWLLNERRLPFLPLPPAVESPTQRSEALERRLKGEPIPYPVNGSDSLKEVVMKACAFNPDDRYATPTDMKYALYVAMGDAEEVPLVFALSKEGTDMRTGGSSTGTTTTNGESFANGEPSSRTGKEAEASLVAAALAAERAAAERADAERADAERADAERRAEEERIAAERAAAERAAAERADAERADAERRAEEERIAAERAAAERADAERADAERADAERRAEEERIAAERAAAECAAAERAAAERRAEEERAAMENQNRSAEEDDGENTMGIFTHRSRRSDDTESSSASNEGENYSDSSAVSEDAERNSETSGEDDYSEREKTMGVFPHQGREKHTPEPEPAPKPEPQPDPVPDPVLPPDPVPPVQLWPQTPEKPKKKKTGWIWIILLLLILLLLAGGAVYVVKNYDDILHRLPINSVEVSGMPDKTVYFAGEELDFNGLTLTAKHLGFLPEEIDSGYSCRPYSFTEAGKQTVTVAYNGQNTTFNVDIVAVVPESLTLKTLPLKTDYFIGDNLDTKGLSVTAKYNNGRTETITEGLTCTPTSFSGDGEQAVTVSWSGIATSFKVTVSKAKVKSIEIDSLPSKRNYVAGDYVDISGLSLTARYDNGDVKTVNSGITYSPESFPLAGRQTVTVTYGGKTAQFEVNVEPVKVSSITIKNYPKQSYFEGDTLNTSNLILHVEYNNHTSADVSTGFSCSPTALTTSVSTITVSYGDAKTTFGVTVKKVELTGIKVKNKPNKTSYFEGDTLNTSGMTLELTYNNGVVQTFSGTSYNCSPTYLSGSGTKTITVTYQGFTATFTVNVTAIRITNVTLASKPTNLKYYTTYKFDTSGLSLKVTYNNGSSQTIWSGFTTSPANGAVLKTAGTTKVTVTYSGYTFTFDITVTMLTTQWIELDTKNVKKTYKVGEKLDLTGLVVKARHNDQTYETVTSYTSTPAAGTAFTTKDRGKDITVTVTAYGKSATFTVHVS